MVYLKRMEKCTHMTDTSRGEKENEEKTVCCSHLAVDCMYAGTDSNRGVSAKLDTKSGSQLSGDLH